MVEPASTSAQAAGTGIAAQSPKITPVSSGGAPAIKLPNAAGASAAAGASGAAAGVAGVAQAAAGNGGQPASAGARAQAGAAGQALPGAGPLTLRVDGEDLGDGFFAFPETARPPSNQSPGFHWTGVPAEAKSLALVFRDVTSATPPVKWVLWNMPPDRTEVPANVSGSSAMPSQIPGASQLGSLGNQGYAGPCCVGNKYEWIIYALDVAELPGTERLSTAQINMDVLPMHTVEKSQPVMMRIKE